MQKSHLFLEDLDLEKELSVRNLSNNLDMFIYLLEIYLDNKLKKLHLSVKKLNI